LKFVWSIAKSSPDGYTLLLAGNTSSSAAPALFKNVPYEPINDFTAIARVGRFSSVHLQNAPGDCSRGGSQSRDYEGAECRRNAQVDWGRSWDIEGVGAADC
jgi:hypothetical protein